MSAYYNENDPKAAAWLRELISAGLIAKGDVDERSIVDVRGSDLAGYTQCHFFAGIGGWSYALRLAGWPDDREVWTGSCPCQPFSQAGKGKGIEDKRHLWPDFRKLIEECAPAAVFGEQVASKAGRGWLNGVRVDLEAMDYEVGASDLCSAGVGAPHIRQRLYWVAESDSQRCAREHSLLRTDQGGRYSRPLPEVAGSGASGRLGHANDARPQGRRFDAGEYADQRATGPAGSLGWMEHAEGIGWSGRPNDIDGGRRELPSGQASEACGLAVTDGGDSGNGSLQRSRQHGQQSSDGGSGFWGAFDIVHCTDNKARRIEPGTFPLAHGIPARMGRLRGYGNAITPEVACEFVIACMEASL